MTMPRVSSGSNHMTFISDGGSFFFSDVLLEAGFERVDRR